MMMQGLGTSDFRWILDHPWIFKEMSQIMDSESKSNRGRGRRFVTPGGMRIVVGQIVLSPPEGPIGTRVRADDSNFPTDQSFALMTALLSE